MPNTEDTIWNYIEENLIYGESNSPFPYQDSLQEHGGASAVELHELIQFVENSLWFHTAGRTILPVYIDDIQQQTGKKLQHPGKRVVN